MHHSFAEISRDRDSFGYSDMAMEEAAKKARNDLGYSRLDHGLLIRIATTLERMEQFLRVACEPMAVEALANQVQRRDDVREGFCAAFNVWMVKEEAKHGPCPNLVRAELKRVARYDWYRYVSRARLHFLTDGEPHLAGVYVRIPTILGRFASPTEPPCGPRSKTRREWKTWRKRRINRKRKRGKEA